MQIRRRRVRVEIDTYELRLEEGAHPPETCVPVPEAPPPAHAPETIPGDKANEKKESL